MITLYHGTNEPFDVPDPNRGRRGTDFGQGFYLTPNFDSAKRMALRAARWKGVQRGVVLRYAVDESERAFASLKIRSFPCIALDWLRFVVANRFMDASADDHNLDARWDVVHGLVADDRVVQILDDLRQGFATEDETLKKLQSAPFQTVQYSFHTLRAVSCLKLQEVTHV